QCNLQGGRFLPKSLQQRVVFFHEVVVEVFFKPIREEGAKKQLAEGQQLNVFTPGLVQQGMCLLFDVFAASVLYAAGLRGSHDELSTHYLPQMLPNARRKLPPAIPATSLLLKPPFSSASMMCGKSLGVGVSDG